MDDLRSLLTALDDIEAPDLWPEIERRAAADAPQPVTARIGLRQPPKHPARRSHAMFIVTVAIGSVVAGALLLNALSPATPGPAGAPASEEPMPAIGWDSGLASLTASAMRITEGDKVFTGEDVYTWDVVSDPGNAAYRTLEIEWQEQDVEQRLFLYFAADETDWWVSELRTRDGFPDADWITYTGPFFTTPIGESYTGDISLASEDGRVPGAIEFVNVVLAAPGLLGSESPLANADNEPEPTVSADAEDEVFAPSPGTEEVTS